MASSRTDLDRPASTTSYLILTIILVILSLAGLYLLFRLKKPDSTPVVVEQSVVPTIVPEPTIEEIITPTSVSTESANPSIVPTVPTAKTSASPTPATLNYTSDTDKFSVVYQSLRKLYQDTEASGNRYTFYLTSGNIAVHVGTQWSWINPNRQFSSDFLVSGLPTFVYGISTQRIVDVEAGQTKYTIQCVHNARQPLIEECDQFLKDFKIQSP